MLGYTVYRTVNQLNGMFYIGVHKTTNPNDDYLGSGKRLKFAIGKYGLENFQKEVLYSFETKEEAYSKEKELVTEDVLDSGACYNLKLGGDGGFDFINSNSLNNSPDFNVRQDRMKVMHSALAKKMHDDPKFNADVKSKKKASALIGYEKWRELYPTGVWNGRVHTEESKQKIRNSSVGKHNGFKNSQFGSKWITDGSLNQKIKKDQEIPHGWKAGRV